MRISTVSARSHDLTFLNVRYNCGFACIRCAATVYQYCTVGDGQAQDDLFLLCPPCRQTLTAMEGGESVLATLRANPVAMQSSLNRRGLPFMSGRSMLEVGIPPDTLMRKTVCPIRFCGEALLVFSPPEIPEGPVQIRLTLGRKDGILAKLIQSNEWLDSESDEWTFQYVGNRYRIASRDGSAWLVLAFTDNRRVTIEELRTHNGPKTLEIDAHGVRGDGTPIELANVDSQVIGADL